MILDEEFLKEQGIKNIKTIAEMVPGVGTSLNSPSYPHGITVILEFNNGDTVNKSVNNMNLVENEIKNIIKIRKRKDKLKKIMNTL